MPTLHLKGKSVVETYHHTLPHHTLAFDPKLSLMLNELLRKGRSIWISIDDNMAQHLRLMFDKVFGAQIFCHTGDGLLQHPLATSTLR